MPVLIGEPSFTIVQENERFSIAVYIVRNKNEARNLKSS